MPLGCFLFCFFFLSFLLIAIKIFPWEIKIEKALPNNVKIASCSPQRLVVADIYCIYVSNAIYTAL